jgi:hypothetical protein
VYGQDALNLVVEHCIFYNSDSSYRGDIAVYNNGYVSFKYCGSRGVYYGFFASQAVIYLLACAATDCYYGLVGTGASSISLTGISINGCNTGLRAQYMTNFARVLAAKGVWGNTTEASPANDTEGNFNSYMSY